MEHALSQPTVWQLTKEKFRGYLIWTLAGMALSPLAYWLLSRH